MINFYLILLIVFTVLFVAKIFESKKTSKMSPDELQRYQNELKWGKVNSVMICPHCQTKGYIYTKSVKKKKGVSGAKATGAILTLGVSMLATGLSRKEDLTQAHCSHCDSTWNF